MARWSIWVDERAYDRLCPVAIILDWWYGGVSSMLYCAAVVVFEMAVWTSGLAVGKETD